MDFNEAIEKRTKEYEDNYLFLKEMLKARHLKTSVHSTLKTVI